MKKRCLSLGISVLSWLLVFGPTAHAKNPNGKYDFKRLSGATCSDGERLKFPPEGIIAAALGPKIVVRNKRIRFNRRAQNDIVKAMRRDPRLHKVLSFQLKSAPRFKRFRKSRDGVFRARTKEPFLISLKFDDSENGQNPYSSTWANYTAEIIGKRMVISVRFQGKIGDFHDWDSERSGDAQVKGRAELVARRKKARRR